GNNPLHKINLLDRHRILIPADREFDGPVAVTVPVIPGFAGLTVTVKVGDVWDPPGIVTVDGEIAIVPAETDPLRLTAMPPAAASACDVTLPVYTPGDPGTGVNVTFCNSSDFVTTLRMTMLSIMTPHVVCVGRTSVQVADPSCVKSGRSWTVVPSMP